MAYKEKKKSFSFFSDIQKVFAAFQDILFVKLMIRTGQ